MLGTKGSGGRGLRSEVDESGDGGEYLCTGRQDLEGKNGPYRSTSRLRQICLPRGYICCKNVNTETETSRMRLLTLDWTCTLLIRYRRTIIPVVFIVVSEDEL